MDLFAALILVACSFLFALLYILFGEEIGSAVDNAFFKISQIGKHNITNNELREKYLQYLNN